MPINFKDAADSYLAEHEKKFSHNRLLTVGASEMGQCAQRTWRAKKEVPPDKDYKPALGAAHRGDLLEDHFTVKIIERAIAGTGAKLQFAGPGQQRTIVAQEWRLSATPDGIITDAPKDLLSAYGVS